MKKILVVEDDKFLSGAYRIKLVRLGFEVQLASDGDEALTRLQSFAPDLILLDLIMPGKDGFSTLIRLRSDQRWKNIPVIVASNLGQQEDIDKSRALGATDFIVKSDISLEQVANKINAILQPAPTQPQTPQTQLSQIPQAAQIQQQSQPAQPSQTTQPVQQSQSTQQPQPSQQAQSSQQSEPVQQPQTPQPAQEKEENVR